MSQSSPERLHALDALRAGALLLGVVLHAAMSFFPTDGIWMIADADRSPALSASFFVIHMFRMALFFLLAGYFGRMVMNRLGAGRFALSRLKRIALPFAVFWPIMMVAFTALVIWAIYAQLGFLPEGDAPPLTWQTVPLTHLWFLYVLLIFYAAALFARPALSLLERSKTWSSLVDGGLRGLLATPLGAVVLALPVAAAMTLAATPVPTWFGIPSPDHGVWPNTPALVGYGLAFALGWMMQRQTNIFAPLKAYAPIYLAAAIGLTVYCLSVVGLTPDMAQQLEPAQMWVFSLAYGVGMWAWIFGLIGLTLRVFSAESAPVRYLADASYWIYIIHLPLVVALQIWMSQWPVPAELKFLLILAISLPIMLASYHFMVRSSFIGWMLSGRIRRKVKTPRAAEPEMQTP
jgi:glucan biosynthesis protein C